jgi:hypothetical protein
MRKNLLQKCMHNKEDVCYLLANNPCTCEDICNFFCSFDEELRDTVNKRIRERRTERSGRLKGENPGVSKTRIRKDENIGIKKGSLRSEALELTDLLVKEKDPVTWYHLNLAYSEIVNSKGSVQRRLS